MFFILCYVLVLCLANVKNKKNLILFFFYLCINKFMLIFVYTKTVKQ